VTQIGTEIGTVTAGEGEGEMRILVSVVDVTTTRIIVAGADRGMYAFISFRVSYCQPIVPFLLLMCMNHLDGILQGKAQTSRQSRGGCTR
jgi:hypothetical protein